MKKILIFHHYNTCVGAGLCLLQIVDSLKSKYEIVVCLPKIKGDLDTTLNKKKIKVVYMNNAKHVYAHYNGAKHSFFSIRHIKNLYNVLCSKNKVLDVIKKVKPDVVLVNSMTLFWIGKLSNKLKIKSICYIRETYCKTLFNVRTNYIKKIINKYFDKVLFISKYDMDETGNEYTKYELITDKVNFELYDNLNKKSSRKELNLPSNKKIILYVGGDNRIKGPMVMLKALKYIQNDVILVYLQHNKPNNVGLIMKLKRILNFDLSYNVEKYVNKNKLSNKVIFCAATNEVEKYFVASDIVVFPNVIAHQARPIYEAGYAKKPVIATDFDNVKEFLNEKTGYVFKNKNSKQLAEIINKVVKNDEITKEKVHNNYEQSLENHSYKDFKKQLNNVIDNFFHKKVGIITLSGNENYGNRLQNYALQETIKNMGFSVETIWVDNYPKKKTIIQNLKFIYKRIFSKGKRVLIKNISPFTQKYINMSEHIIYSDSNLKYLNNEYDYFVVGSDQVWNYSSGIMGDHFFLTFSEFNKNIAYAPSFSVNTIPKNYKEKYSKLLNNIKYVSVRENNGKELVKELISKDVPVVLDPTLLLDKENWLNLEKKPNFIKDKKYIITYFLGGISESISSEILKMSNKEDLIIIDLMNLKKKQYLVSVNEFLYLINHANLVLTDSFHASVFSIIFETPFLVYERNNGYEMGSRINTLLSITHLKERKIKSFNDIDNIFRCDFTDAKKTLKKEKKKSLNFLKEALGIKESDINEK